MRSVNFGKAIPFASLGASRLKRATGVFLKGLERSRWLLAIAVLCMTTGATCIPKRPLAEFQPMNCYYCSLMQLEKLREQRMKN